MLTVTIRKKIEKLLEIIEIKWEDINIKSSLQMPKKKKKKRGRKKSGKKDKSQKKLGEF